jgi:hypothetical protein
VHYREEFVAREREISDKLQRALTCAAAVRASGKKKKKKKGKISLSWP